GTSYHVCVSQGQSCTVSSWNSTDDGAQRVLYVGDFDGDKRQDFMTFDGKIRQSKGNSFYFATGSTLGSTATHRIVGDFNGDGRNDVTYFRTDGTNQWRTFLSSAKQVDLAATVTNPLGGITTATYGVSASCPTCTVLPPTPAVGNNPPAHAVVASIKTDDGR